MILLLLFRMVLASDTVNASYVCKYIKKNNHVIYLFLKKKNEKKPSLLNRHLEYDINLMR